MGTLDVVVGAQYGSEAKGAVTGWLSQRYGDDTTIVRVAGPNAGHTAYDRHGTAWALRQVPVGLVTNPEAKGVIADGSEVDLPVLLDELARLDAAGHNASSRLLISGAATLLTEEHHRTETAAGMSGRIGSTGKGIGACRADRIMRTAQTVHQALAAHGVGGTLRKYYPSSDPSEPAEELNVTDELGTADLLRRALWFRHVVIEGTQGFGLGLHQPHYPQVTSSNTRAIDFLSLASISPWSDRVDQFAVWLVARAYPIRVAGNSGPMLDETSWDELGLPVELTTVTKKPRRVGGWDQELFDRAMYANGGRQTYYSDPPVKVAYTMADQQFKQLAGLDGKIGDLDLNQEQQDAIQQIQLRTRGLVRYIGTGPNSRIEL